MKHMKVLVASIFLIAVIAMIAGCGAARNDEGANGGGETAAVQPTGAPQAQNQTETSSQQSADETVIRVEHTMGTATLKKVPERVVVLFNGMVDISVALGVKPVGAVESWDEKPWYHYLRSSMDGVESLGEETQPNIEAIVALKPDLIIGTKPRHEKIYPQLESIAPTIMTEAVFDWKDNLRIAAEALGKQDEAARIMSEWDARVAEFKQKMGDRAGQTEVSLIRFQPDGTARIYVTGFAGTVFEELGLARPAAQHAEGKTILTLTSKEQIPALDGDMIFDITSPLRGDEDAARNQSEWTSHPLWKNLKGVKNDKYFKVNTVTWNLAGGSIAAKSLLDDIFHYMDLE